MLDQFLAIIFHYNLYILSYYLASLLAYNYQLTSLSVYIYIIYMRVHTSISTTICLYFYTKYLNARHVYLRCFKFILFEIYSFRNLSFSFKNSPLRKMYYSNSAKFPKGHNIPTFRKKYLNISDDSLKQI